MIFQIKGVRAIKFRLRLQMLFIRISRTTKLFLDAAGSSNITLETLIKVKKLLQDTGSDINQVSHQIAPIDEALSCLDDAFNMPN